MRRLLAVALIVGAGLVAWGLLSDGEGDVTAGPGEDGWAALDAQARCDSAVGLVTHPDRWPIRCRWREPGERLAGQAFPPPPGPPPFDDPHVEVYVDPGQTRDDVARAVAHELGHMHHTRRPTFVAEWLAARNLDPATPSELWTEDYAEVFAALYAPPSPAWRAPTSRPSPEALAELKDRFFEGDRPAPAA